MAERKTTKKTASSRAKAKPQKAIKAVEVEPNDKLVENEEKPVVKRNVVGTGVHSADESTANTEKELAALKEQNEKLQKQIEQLMAMQGTPSVIQVETKQEKVCFLWQAEVAEDNMVILGENGKFGKIVGKTGTIYVPKSELSMLLDSQARLFVKKRWLIAVSGLTDEERESLGMDYKPGEILDKGAFARLVELGDEILEIFPKLCESHKEIVAKRYYEEWMAHNPLVKRETVVALNSICKKDCPEIGAFAKIIEEMNQADLEK